MRRTILVLVEATHAARPRCRGFRAARICSRRSTPRRNTSSSRAVHALAQAAAFVSAVENTYTMIIINSHFHKRSKLRNFVLLLIVLNFKTSVFKTTILFRKYIPQNYLIEIKYIVLLNFVISHTLSSQASLGSQRCGHTSGLSAARSSSTQRRDSCSPGEPPAPPAPAAPAALAPVTPPSFTYIQTSLLKLFTKKYFLGFH